MKVSMIKPLITLLACVWLSQATLAYSKQYNDSASLEGVKNPKTLFDINLTTAKKLELYLTVIKMTYDDISRQGHKPEMVVAFRGGSVRLINSETWSFSEEDQLSLEKSAAVISELVQLGIKVEACSIATDLFKVDNNTLLPGIKVVGNTFVSLTGYQNKGYALVPIQ
jgi:intracellular sulfur oxidation DsrE/DsrF family protein